MMQAMTPPAHAPSVEVKAQRPVTATKERQIQKKKSIIKWCACVYACMCVPTVRAHACMCAPTVRVYA